MENKSAQGWYLILKENSVEARFLSSENDFNSNLLSRVPRANQTLSDFDTNINSRTLNIPGVDGTFKHGDLVIVYGKDAEQLKRTYDKGGPFDTLKVASVDWNA